MKLLKNEAHTDGLCVLHAHDADMSRTGRFRGYISFGDWVDHSDGPSVRFHGGTPFSGRLDNAPVMHFNIYGDCTIAPAMWMNAHNCPNVFDEEFMKQITVFVRINLPILYLVYERYLDKADALAYFEGRIDWESMIASVYRIPDELYSGLLGCEDNAQLHTFCVSEQIYGKQELEPGRPLLCETLKTKFSPVFEIELWGEEAVLTKYNGRSALVWIPDHIDVIGANAFSGHGEIKKLIIPGSVQHIGESAFFGCSGMEALMIPASVWDVSEWAFANCTQLRSVCIEKQLDHELYLSKEAFSGCTNLKEIFLPELVLFDGHPFENCPQLHIVCASGADAEQFARDNGIPYSADKKNGDLDAHECLGENR